MTLARDLIDIERKLWTNDAGFYKESLLKEAVLVFPETGVITRDVAVHAIVVENAEGRKWAEVEFDDVRTLALSHDTALLIYRVAARWQHEPSKSSALASSIYVKRGDRWKLAFHQQTPLQGELI
jgi:glyoxylase I family protein